MNQLRLVAALETFGYRQYLVDIDFEQQTVSRAELFGNLLERCHSEIKVSVRGIECGIRSLSYCHPLFGSSRNDTFVFLSFGEELLRPFFGTGVVGLVVVNANAELKRIPLFGKDLVPINRRNEESGTFDLEIRAVSRINSPEVDRMPEAVSNDNRKRTVFFIKSRIERELRIVDAREYYVETDSHVVRVADLGYFIFDIHDVGMQVVCRHDGDKRKTHDDRHDHREEFSLHRCPSVFIRTPLFRFRQDGTESRRPQNALCSSQAGNSASNHFRRELRVCKEYKCRPRNRHPSQRQE